MVEGITEDQYRQLNEFPLSEQARSLPAFSGRPLLYRSTGAVLYSIVKHCRMQAIKL